MRSDLCVLFLILSLFYSNALLLPGCYIHIPFCRRRCYYCDFPIRVVGDRPGAANEAAANYVALVEREIRATESVYGQAVREAGGLRTVYFGGGV